MVDFHESTPLSLSLSLSFSSLPSLDELRRHFFTKGAVFVAICREDIRVPASASTRARSEGATPVAPATPDTAAVLRAGTAPASPKVGIRGYRRC